MMNCSKYFKNKIAAIHFLAFLANLTISVQIANAQIIKDSTLGSNQSRITDNVDINGTSVTFIDRGVIQGINLFHSFQEFNVSKNQNVYFDNPIGILNIIARVTSIDPFNVSNIMGTLGVKNINGVLGKANLFLINPNGITFGSNSSLNLGGSFIATTAHAIQFQNQGSFDALNPNYPPLLNINPSGFLFTKDRIAPIKNLSQSSSGENIYLDPIQNNLQTDNLTGLRVANGRSLLLLGGPINLDGGGLYSLGGRVELVSVSGKGVVDLSFIDDENITLKAPSDLIRDNIFGINSRIYTSGNNSAGGNVQIIGKNIQFKGGSQVFSATTGSGNGGTILLDAIEAIRLSDFTPNGVVSTITYDSGNAGNIKISAGKFTVDQQAQIISSTQSNGRGGDININANESITLKGVPRTITGIFSSTVAQGIGGDIFINTLGDLILSNNARIDSGGTRIRLLNGNIISPPTGTGGNIQIKAGSSVQIDQGRLSAASINGDAGNIDIVTKSLSVNNGIIRVSSNLKQSGTISITANSLALKNGADISANTGVSGANIFFTVLDVLSLENESTISATATGNADGGNITINTPILLVLPPTGPNGSDIVATAFEGRGGNIVINSKGIFGIEQREAIDDNQTNDIDASSDFGPSGQVQINTTTDPNQGLLELPATVIDPSTLVAQNPCRHSSRSEFTRSGRGGLPPSLSQDLSSQTTQVGLVEPTNLSAAKPAPTTASKSTDSPPLSSSQIAPAKGWVYNEKGEVVLVAYNSAITGPQRLQSNPKGCPVL